MILLVAPSLDVAKFKGVAKTSLELTKRLNYDEIFVVYRTFSYLNNLTTTPLKELLSKADIVHSTVPESASFLPFFFWKKSIVTFHDFIPMEIGKRLKFKFEPFANSYTKMMWKLASKCKCIIANSSQTAEEVRKYYNRKAVVINPGVDERFKPKKVLKDKITLGFFSSFTFRKGVDKAIEVYKLVKKKIDCKLILAGGHSSTFFQREHSINRLIEGLNDVEVRRYVRDEEIVDLYNSFDFFLFPSMYEGFGIPILEAQACGIPTLIFENARIPKETREKTIKCKDINDMANKILTLIDDRKKYNIIRREGIKYAKNFTWEKFANLHKKIYESLGSR
jgi:glycosyltransferase involved in cell wall biosynthesis